MGGVKLKRMDEWKWAVKKPGNMEKDAYVDDDRRRRMATVMITGETKN